MKKHIILILLILSSIVSLFAQYDNADAIYDKIVREYTLNKDGSTQYREFKQLKLLSHASFNRFYGETFIVYNPHYQSLTISESYTIMADGSKVVAPPNSFNEVLPRNAAQSAAFNHLREMVVTHIATEIGATIFLDYSLTSKKGYWPALMGNEVIRESSPVRQMEIRVRVPRGVKLNFKLFNGESRPELDTKGTEQVYSWKFENIPASSKEPYPLRNQGAMPRLVFSTARNLSALSSWVAQQPAFDFQISEPMQQKVTKIAAEQADETKLLLALQKEVAQMMVYDRAEPIYVGFRARKPIDVFASNGGTQLEKSILLTALLRHATFDATPVLVGPRALFDANASNLLQFDEAAVMVQTKSHGTLYLSATAVEKQSLEFKYADAVLLPLSKSKNNLPVMPAPSENTISLKGKLVVDTNLKLNGTLSAEMTGATNPFFAFKESSKSGAAILSGGIVAKGDESVSLPVCTKNKSAVAFLIEKDNLAKATNGYYRWELPVINTGFEGWNLGFLANSRVDPLAVLFPVLEQYEYIIELPEGFRVVNPETQINLSCAAGHAKIVVQPAGNQIKIIRELRITKPVVAVEDYPAFRDMINTWLDRNNRVIVFSKQF